MTSCPQSHSGLQVAVAPLAILVGSVPTVTRAGGRDYTGLSVHAPQPELCACSLHRRTILGIYH
jgi:hypothetical protein